MADLYYVIAGANHITFWSCRYTYTISTSFLGRFLEKSGVAAVAQLRDGVLIVHNLKINAFSSLNNGFFQNTSVNIKEPQGVKTFFWLVLALLR